METTLMIVIISCGFMGCMVGLGWTYRINLYHSYYVEENVVV
jgi:hypothetical protein